MRTLLGIAATITALIVWHTIGWPLVGWLFTRIPPATPSDWQPKHRRWVSGIEVAP